MPDDTNLPNEQSSNILEASICVNAATMGEFTLDRGIKKELMEYQLF